MVQISNRRIKHHAERTVIFKCCKLGENLESTPFFDIDHLHLKLGESLNLESTLQHFPSFFVLDSLKNDMSEPEDRTKYAAIKRQLVDAKRLLSQKTRKEVLNKPSRVKREEESNNRTEPVDQSQIKTV